jgi:hypothetical protein
MGLEHGAFHNYTSASQKVQMKFSGNSKDVTQTTHTKFNGKTPSLQGMPCYKARGNAAQGNRPPSLKQG